MDYSNNWLWRMHPLLSALATNPAFYYYYTAKADLLNQSIMVRRGSSRTAAKKSQTSSAHSSNVVVPAGGGTVAVPGAILPTAIPYPANLPPNVVSSPAGNSGPQGTKRCPQCSADFNSTSCRPVQEACGHWKCRTCMIANEDGCPQCRQVDEPSPPPRGPGSRRQGRSNVTQLDDLSPPILMEEEPMASSSSSCSVDKGQRSTPPILSKTVGTKRKQKEASPSGPSKILRTAAVKAQNSDPRERPKIMTRRSSSSQSSSSPPKYSPTTSPKVVKGPANLVKGSKVKGLLKFSKDDNGPSFAVTISPTTIPVKGPGSSHRTKPVLSPPAKSSSKGCSTSSSGSLGGDDLGFAITSSSTSSAMLVTEGGSNSSNSSHSTAETSTDPLYISNEWAGGDSNSNSIDQPELGEDGVVKKKKKKRSPVTIHDHITILSGDPLLYQCNVCMKKFKTKAHIKYHEFCQNGEKPYKCEQCGQGFIAKSHYEYHLRTHTGERPYVCPKCGKGFNQRGKVTRHMRSHTGEKPFICQQCGRGFANAQALRSHFLIHTGERPFACQYCNKRFTGMTNLKKHVITHTGERPFTCNHCGKSFGLKWTLDLHLRTHSTERPFQCDQCTRAFSNSKDLRRHLVIHSGERPFKCWICGTAFRRKDNLDRHIKNTHNQPKEVAKQLANEAAAEYMAQTKATQAALAAANASTQGQETSNEGPSTSRANSDEQESGVLPNILNRGGSTKKKDVIITADLSPPSSPAQVALDGSAVRDVYVLPNGQGQLQPAAVIHTVGADGKPTVEAHFVSVGSFESLAQLRTVPVNEYHQLEGVALLEKAKSSTSPAEKEGQVCEEEEGEEEQEVQVEDKDVKPSVGGDILFCGAPTGTTADGGRNLTEGLTVTVVYENDGKTHFITDQPPSTVQYNSATVDPLSFSTTQQSTGLMAIPRETLFSFASTSSTSTTASAAASLTQGGPDENNLEDSSSTITTRASTSTPSSTSERTSEIHLKKSETILSGNLSKYLQMDLPIKTTNLENFNSSEDDQGEAGVISSHQFQQVEQRQLFNSSEMMMATNEQNNDNNCAQQQQTFSSSCSYGGATVKSEIDIEYVTRAVGTPDPEVNDNDDENNGNQSPVSPAPVPTTTATPDAYPSDPMFQNPDADDQDERLEAGGEEDTRQIPESTTTTKSGEDSLLTDGMDTYGSPQAIFPENLPPPPAPPPRNKDHESFEGIVDKECPSSILQDEPNNILQDEPNMILQDEPNMILQDQAQNCDPISDDEDFNNSSSSFQKGRLESLMAPESPLEAGELPRQSAAPPHDNDTESISSTEFEPDEPKGSPSPDPAPTPGPPALGPNLEPPPILEAEEKDSPESVEDSKKLLEIEEEPTEKNNCSENWSETEPISDTEFDDPEVEDEKTSFTSWTKRQRPEENNELDKETCMNPTPVPKNVLSPTAAASSYLAAAAAGNLKESQAIDEANNKLDYSEYIEQSTNLNSSVVEEEERTESDGGSGDLVPVSLEAPEVLSEAGLENCAQDNSLENQLDENSIEEEEEERMILVSNVRSLGPSTSTLETFSSSSRMDDDSSCVIIKTEEISEPEIQTVAMRRKTTRTSETVTYEMVGNVSQGLEMISPGEAVAPEATAQVAYVAIPEAAAPAGLIYTTSPLITPTILVAQPVNLSSAPTNPSTSSSTSSWSSSGNYQIVYAPQVPVSQAASTASPSFRFVYENGEPVLENLAPVLETSAVDKNMRIVYACAAATADPPGNCGAQKLKLLYAEALGVGSPDESGQVQLVYTSTAPNQNLTHAPNQNVRIYSPAFLQADKNIVQQQSMQNQQQQQQQVEQGPVPVQVLYNGNGMVMAQTVGQPQDLSWIRQHSFSAGQSLEGKTGTTATATATSSSNTRNNLASTRDIIANHHNYASSPYVHVDKEPQQGARVRFPGPFTVQQGNGPGQTFQRTGEQEGLRTLARAAATRMITIQADADATTRAAAAIAAVGREAQIKRQMDMIERNKNLPGHSPINNNNNNSTTTTTTLFIRKGENVPHRGPRKHYLSQLTNSSRK